MQKSSASKDTLKVTYSKQDLSAFFVENLIRALKLSQVQVKRIASKAASEGDIEKSGMPLTFLMCIDVTNVKLETGASSIPLLGELTIGDALVAEHNRTTGSKCPRLSQDLVFDHWAYFLNNHVRETVQDYIVTKTPENKETLKRLIKEVDDKLYPILFASGKDQPLKYGDLSLLHIMYFSYLEPVKVMTNNIVKSLLPKMRDALGLLNYDQFKTGGEGSSAADNQGSNNAGKKASKSVALH
jgi:hypothetical protein